MFVVRERKGQEEDARVTWGVSSENGGTGLLRVSGTR